MDDSTRRDYIKEVEDLGLTRIKSTSKIQRTLLSATRLDPDVTRAISDYYFPLDISAIQYLAEVDIRLFRIVVLLACDMGIWPIVRIATKKKLAQLLKPTFHNPQSTRLINTVAHFKGKSLIQTYYNLASYQGYQHLADLFLKHGASRVDGVKFHIQGGCHRQFEKVFNIYFQDSHVAKYLEWLCGRCRVRCHDHVLILEDLIYEDASIYKTHFKEAKKNTPNPHADISKKFLSIIESQVCHNIYH